MFFRQGKRGRSQGQHGRKGCQSFHFKLLLDDVKPHDVMSLVTTAVQTTVHITASRNEFAILRLSPWKIKLTP
jgi:hypothetical protein